MNYWINYQQPKPSGLHLPLTNYQQLDKYSCGYIAALTVASYLKPDTNPEEVFNLVTPIENWGVSRDQIINGLYELGISVDFRKDITLSNLRWYIRYRKPVIITVWPDGYPCDHWTVVKGFSANEQRVYLTNHPVLSIREFRKQWLDWYSEGNERGWGLVCSRG